MDVTFGIGSASATVQVPIIDDNTIEDPEIFTASLSTTQTNVMFGDDTATITIFDNDSELSLRVCILHLMFPFYSIISMSMSG